MITKRRFIQGSILAALLPLQFRIHTAESNMQKRIAEIINEYAGQGIHRTGTEVDQLSADWLKARITALGVEATETSFPIHRVQPVKTSISLPGLRLSGVPLYDCRYTDEEGISGTLGEVGSNAEIGVAMVLPFAASEISQRIHSARLADQHKAIVIVTDDRLPSNGVAPLNAEHFTEPFGPPVLQIENKHWPEIKSVIDAFENQKGNLLNYQVLDGWLPLCEFLDKQVPESDFPNTNSRQQFQTLFDAVNNVWQSVKHTSCAYRLLTRAISARTNPQADAHESHPTRAIYAFDSS